MPNNRHSNTNNHDNDDDESMETDNQTDESMYNLHDTHADAVGTDTSDSPLNRATKPNIDRIADDIVEDMLGDAAVTDPLKNALADHLESVLADLRDEIASLEAQLEQKNAEINRLRSNLGELMDSVDDAREIEPDIDSVASDADSMASNESLDNYTSPDCPLEEIAEQGPTAVIEETQNIYEVHRRAALVIREAANWGVHRSEPGRWAVYLTVPAVRPKLEAARGEDLTSTQMRRVFEKVVDWGAPCPDPPKLQKNEEGVRELVVYDPPRPKTDG